MVIWIVIGMLAAFGALCALWALSGFLLPHQDGGVTVCVCRGDGKEEPLIHRYRWLQGMGLIHCPLILLDGGLSEADKARLTRQGLTVCDKADLTARVEQEREKLDRT